MYCTAQHCVTAGWHWTTRFDPVPTIRFIEWVSLLWDIPELSYHPQTKEGILARGKSLGAFVLLWTDTQEHQGLGMPSLADFRLNKKPSLPLKSKRKGTSLELGFSQFKNHQLNSKAHPLLHNIKAHHQKHKSLYKYMSKPHLRPLL